VTSTIVVLFILAFLVVMFLITTVHFARKADNYYLENVGLSVENKTLLRNLDIAQKGILVWKQEYERVVRSIDQVTPRTTAVKTAAPPAATRTRAGAGPVRASSPSVVAQASRTGEEVVAVSDLVADQVLMVAALEGLRQGATVASEEPSHCEPAHHHHSDHSNHGDHGGSHHHSCSSSSGHSCASSSGHSCSSSSSCGGSSCGGGG
jgi:uncharacterized membrane protein YgcG